jgi:hypothetical protein
MPAAIGQVVVLVKGCQDSLYIHFLTSFLDQGKKRIPDEIQRLFSMSKSFLSTWTVTAQHPFGTQSL